MDRSGDQMMKNQIRAIGCGGKMVCWMWSVPAIVGKRAPNWSKLPLTPQIESVPSLPKRSRPKVLISDHFWIIIRWRPDQNYQSGYQFVLKEELRIVISHNIDKNMWTHRLISYFGKFLGWHYDEITLLNIGFELIIIQRFCSDEVSQTFTKTFLKEEKNWHWHSPTCATL